MTELTESVLRGLGTGSVYALLALGFVIIYKATRVISFAQPAFMLAGVVAVTYLAPAVGFWAAVPLAAVGTGLLALGVERAAVRPMVGRPAFVVAIITLGVDVAVRVVVNAFIGLDVRHVGDPWGLRTLSLGPVELQQRHLAAVAATGLLVAGLFAFFRFTRTGLAMRAAALDQEAALAHGVSVGAVFAVSWALAGGLAAVAGTFAAAGASVDAALWLIALTALPVIILGGLDSLPGAVVGGLAVGVLQELTATYANDLAWLGGNVSVITPYVLMLVVLLVRPYGLFGTREVERV
ncbi:branched-chain amino acid ABC transporter permease [Micromonospora sp. C28SCA-DRY-2]|uniref:branched-chain amino acid ABC transporter permease n=1 Tax=Micromonospora TaxID=1873 RepID=UPI000D6F1010|nr:MULTISPECIES: branched-chain amino acid ABC transporter permease [unclassified Micromonospora]MDO3705345.1 branched-chain amino acid ABC transporter permease [Micromonospora sp. C28SCA-DRY-2]PWU51911.1 branched-chain amino acid ABC transporter permease [Micromonospora sp. S4605]